MKHKSTTQHNICAYVVHKVKNSDIYIILLFSSVCAKSTEQADGFDNNLSDLSVYIYIYI